MIETISYWRSVPCPAKLPTPDFNCLRPGSTAISSRLIFLMAILKFYPLCPFLHRRPTSKYDDRHMQRIADDRELYGGLIRLHVLHHANEKPLYGQWMIEELQRHEYQIGPGTIYPLLHSLARKGYLRSRTERSGSRYRRVYRITPTGRRALNSARRRVQELFGEMFARRLNP